MQIVLEKVTFLTPWYLYVHVIVLSVLYVICNIKTVAVGQEKSWLFTVTLFIHIKILHLLLYSMFYLSFAVNQLLRKYNS